MGRENVKNILKKTKKKTKKFVIVWGGGDFKGGEFPP